MKISLSLKRNAIRLNVAQKYNTFVYVTKE